MQNCKGTTGVAFSGGGIRSAALCSGVLRRLLQRSVKVDYVSCVSGGNFVATAYLDWKYRNECLDKHSWHKRFFEHLRERTGYFCDWQKTIRGIGDTLVLLLLLVFVNVIIPFLVWGSLSVPIAYVIDYLFGGILRAGFVCGEYIKVNKTTKIVIGNTSRLATNLSEICSRPEFDPSQPQASKQVITIAVLFFFTLTLYIVSRKSNYLWIKTVTKVLSSLAATFLAFTFVPWLLEQFISATPLWINIVFIVISVIFWLGFPPLRKRASLCLVIFAFSYVVKWRVYKNPVAGVSYSEQAFHKILIISGAIIWASPYLGIFKQTAIFNYIKWRLQKAFYTTESAGRFGCQGIECSDLFPIVTAVFCCKRADKAAFWFILSMFLIILVRVRNLEHSLNLIQCSIIIAYRYTEHQILGVYKYNALDIKLGDLHNMKPYYISNWTVDQWKKTKSLMDPTYSVMAVSPDLVERIDRQPDEEEFKGKLNPMNIRMSDAMTTAAAVIAPAEDVSKNPGRDLQIVLGLAARNHIRSDPNEDYKCECPGVKLLPFLIQSMAALPIILLAIIPIFGWNSGKIETYAVILLITYTAFFFTLASIHTGSRNPWFLDPFVRWSHVHLYHVRFLREIMHMNNIGPVPPAMLNISDAGRLEKYGLLPLLKRRLKKIVVVDGSLILNDKTYAKSILKSMKLAREILRCGFVGYDGRDVMEEIKKKFVDPPAGQQPRSYRFKVKYYEQQDGSIDDVQVGSGEILLLTPRHPQKGVPFTSNLDATWDQYAKDTGEELEKNLWGPGPVLEREEVDRLTFCCCSCCHSNSKIARWLSAKMCLRFPGNTTANQFFTPDMFSAYHREGYRACVEAGADKFLGEFTAVNMNSQ